MADAADGLYREALAACEQGRVADALPLLQRATALDPGQARIHALAGKALSYLGRNEEALASFDRAVALGSASADLFGGRADVLLALGRLADAVESYDRALALKPNSVEDWCNRGAVLLELDRHQEALTSFDRALELDPALADAHNNRANALDRIGRANEAIAAADRALAIDPEHRGARITRAVMLRKRGRSADALADCERMLAQTPDDVEALTVQGDVLIDLERFDEAIAALDAVIARDPAAVAAKWNKSLVCLGLGRFAEGWPLYRHRWQGAAGLVPRAYPQPPWNGGRVNGPLLVWGEQGLGDEILHSSMLPDLIARTPEIVLEVEPRLVPLFARSFPQLRVIPIGPALYGGPIAAHVPVGDLGYFFRPNWEAFPKRERGYLVADATRAQALRARLGGDGRYVIGLSWISKAPVGGAQKTARLHDFAALLRMPGLRFVDLQYGDTASERTAVERDLGVAVKRLPDIDTTNDLDGLAALMTACDAVVTVSNTTAHLAGALGRPTVVMVPHGFARIWYWFRDRDTSPWYPRVAVRRQRRGQSWADLIAAVANEVPALARP
jgi:tetratricopeptide (TPR) repeat protein